MAIKDPYGVFTPGPTSAPAATTDNAQHQPTRTAARAMDPYGVFTPAPEPVKPGIFGGLQPHKAIPVQNAPRDPYAADPVPKDVGSAGVPDARWTRRYDATIEDAARRSKIDPSILRGILATETTGNPHAQSGVGAVGLGQFMPGTGAEYGLFDKAGHDLRTDPIRSIYASARYLSNLIHDENGDVIKAVAAYNEGPGNVAKYGIDGLTETHNYWRRVLSVAQKYGYGQMQSPAHFLTMAAPELHPPAHVKPGTPQHHQIMEAGIGQTGEAIAHFLGDLQTRLHNALQNHPVVGQAYNRITMPASWIMDIAQRPDQANLARHAGRSFWGTLLHGESPEQYRKDTETATQQFINAKWLGATEHLDLNQLPAYRRFIDEFVTQTLYDPTIFLSKLGTFRKLGELSEAHTLPAAVRFGQAAAAGTKTGTVAQRAVSHVLKAASDAVSGVHTLLGVHSDAKKYLAATHGPGWVEQYAQTLATKGGQRQMATVGTAVFHEKLDQILQGLSNTQKVKVFKALHAGTTENLPSNLNSVANEISQWTDSIAHLQGDDVLRGTLEVNHGFRLPDYAQDFQAEGGRARGIMGTENYRENYITIPHELSALSGDEAATKEFTRLYEMTSGHARTIDELRDADPFLRPRNDPKGLPNDASIFENALKNRVRAAFGSITANDAQAALAKQYGGHIPEPIKQLFTHNYKFQDELGGAERLGNQWRNVMDWGKSSLFIIPTPHMANIAILGAINNLGAVGHAAVLTQDMFKMTAAQRLAKYREEIELGIVGEPHNLQNDARTLSDIFKQDTHAVNDQSSPFMRSLTAIGNTAIGRATGLHQIANLYRWSNRTLWSFDDAMKIALYRVFKKQFNGNKARAAYETMASLVDYSNRSPLGEGLRYIDNFATWTTKKPVAVLRALVRHPELVSAVTRLNPTLGGGDQTIGGQTYRGVGPIAETGQLGSAISGNSVEAVRMARARMSPPLQTAAGSLPGIRDFAPAGYQGKMPYWTYGNDPLSYGLVQISGIFAPLQYGNVGVFSQSANKPQSLRDVALTAAKNLALQSARLTPEAKKNAKQEYINKQINEGVPIWKAERDWYKQHPKLHLGAPAGLKL